MKKDGIRSKRKDRKKKEKPYLYNNQMKLSKNKTALVLNTKELIFIINNI